MLHEFLHNVELHLPQMKQGVTLLAVSGGVDSIVMTRLFAAAGLPFAVAHCNFQLRGGASDEDEVFVRRLAEELGIPYHTVVFETQQIAAERGVSIQMVARELRYEWLEKVRHACHYQFIATAHHLNDSIETSLLNQIRGTGIRGLTGIALLHEHLVRPMLFFTRAQIEAYLEANRWDIREDSSNSKDEYYRNRLRHHVLPVLQSINPSLEQTFATNFRIWRETAHLLEWAVAQLREKYVSEAGQRVRIDFSFIEEQNTAAATLLYEWLKGYGFHPDQLIQAIDATENDPGAIWYSETHRLLADREAFWVAALSHTDEVLLFELAQPGDSVELPDGLLSTQAEAVDSGLAFGTSPWEVVLDADQLAFPLQIRHWEEGDIFQPLGMDGHRKKVQDFFTDLKINRFDKEKIWLLTTAEGQIAWLIGYRIDERYKIRPETENALRLRFSAK
jgi:tRNA(Ile)-lysidine synthase